jgi:diguanylate cyclase (GGDEF)-like protein
MDLNQKLVHVPKNRKPEFLRKKLRELRLLYRVDRITDKHRDLASLAAATLKLARGFFRCQTAALLFTDREARHRQFYLALGLDSHPSRDHASQHVKELLNGTIDSPGSSEVVNRGNGTPTVPTDYVITSFAVSDRLGGALLIGEREEAWNEEDLHYLRAIVSQIDNGLEHAFLMQKYQRSRRRIEREARKLSFVYEISLSLGREEDFTSLCRRILESSMQLVEVNRCSFMLYDPEKDELRTEFAIGIPFRKSQVTLKMGEGVAGSALKEGRATLATKGSVDSRFIPFNRAPEEFPDIVNLACLPLIVDGYPFGVLNFSSSDPKYTVTPDELAALEVVSQLVVLAWQKQRLYQMSIKDELTGLYSFRFFKQRLQEEMVRAQRQETPLSVVLFDIDFFKKFNDSNGHPAGNMALKCFADILRNSIRQGVDVPARFGGEEFVLVLPGTPEAGAVFVAERIRVAVEAANVRFEGKSLSFTVSGGVRQLVTGMMFDDFVQAADQALYKAKDGGRNRIEVFSVPA